MSVVWCDRVVSALARIGCWPLGRYHRARSGVWVSHDLCGDGRYGFFSFFFSSRRRHTRWPRDWSSDVCSSDLIKRGIWPVAGCDEAGRGPLAGPVVAAAVILDPDRIPRGIDDSKRLTPEEREELFDEICATSSFAVA